MNKECILILLLVFLVVIVCSSFSLAEGSNYDKKYVFTVNIMNPDAIEDDVRYKFIKEKFNVDFEFRPVNWTNWEEKIRIWTASGDMPDIMWRDFQANTFSEYVNWASQGAYKPLPELKDKYPNLYKLRQKMKTDDCWEIDGKLYAWPIYMNPVDWRDPLVSTFGILYRVDWAKKVGLFHEDHNYSWKEMKGMAQAFVEEDPGNNGAGKTIGFAGVGWAWPWFTGLIQTHQLNDFAIKDGRYVWAAAQPEYLEGIKEIKRLYDNKILWEDQPIANNDAARNKFIAGELGMYYTNVNVGGYYNDILVPMKQANENIDVYEDVEPMFVASPRGNYFAQEVVDYWSATLFSPKMSDEKLARWLEISNYMASEEGMRLSTIGIKEQHYRLNEDGEVELLWEQDEKGNYLSPFDPKAIRFFELTTLHDVFAFNDPGVPVEVKGDVKDIVHRNLADDVYVLPYSYQTNWFNGTNYTRYMGRLADTNDVISDLVVSTGSMEELEEKWVEYIKSKRSTVDKILNELNEELLNH